MPHPAFRREVERATDMIPLCVPRKNGDGSPSDVVTDVEIDFTKKLPPQSAPDGMLQVNSYIPPLLIMKNATIDNSQLYLASWIQNEYTIPREIAKMSEYCDTLLIRYKIMASGRMADASVLECANSAMASSIMNTLARSPNWLPAKVNNISADCIMEQYLIISTLKGEKEKPYKSYLAQAWQREYSHDEVSTGSDDEEKVYTKVDRMPRFKGGSMDKFSEWMNSRYSWPEPKVYGKFSATYIVEKDGSVSSVKVIDTPAASVSAEMLDCFNKAPKWEPGMQNGQPVRVQMRFGVNLVEGGTTVYAH